MNARPLQGLYLVDSYRLYEFSIVDKFVGGVGVLCDNSGDLVKK